MRRNRTPLDTYDMRPSGMVAYLRYNGWHFNKKLCEWAVGNMEKMNPSTGKMEKAEPISKETTDELLKVNEIEIENNTGYDYVYVANMASADFYKSSIKEEASLARFIKDYIDDPDQADGFVLNRFYADCNHNGIGIPWDDVL